MLAPRKCLPGDEQGTGVAGENRSEERDHRCFGEREVSHGIVERIDTQEPERRSEEEQFADGTGAKGSGCFGVPHVEVTGDGRNGHASEEHLKIQRVELAFAFALAIAFAI